MTRSKGVQKPRPIEHRIEWILVEELLSELSGGVPYSVGWASRVMGVDERTTLRYKVEGVPDEVADNLLDRANRGVVYDQEHPPSRGVISGQYSRHYYRQHRVPYKVVEPHLKAKLGEDFTPDQARSLFGITRSTYYSWRKTVQTREYKYPGFPVDEVVRVLGVAREELVA